MEGNSLLIRFGLCLKFILLANGDTIRDGAGDVSPPLPLHLTLKKIHYMNMC